MKPLKPPSDDEALARDLRASRVLVDAPEALVQRAVQLFQPLQRGAAPAAPIPLLPRLLAALRFDSAGAAPWAHGRRSGLHPAGGEVRQLLYALEDCDVDLRVVPADGGLFSLSGQLLGPVCSGVVAVGPEGALAGGPGVAAGRAELNEWGEFQLPPLAGGAWRVWLELPDRIIELPPLQLAADAPPPV